MKFGIIGTNFVSDYFMKGAQLTQDCEVSAVCATSLAKAEAFAAKYDIPHCYDDYQKMFDDSVVEAVYVAVPNSLHHRISKYFLERGIPVFCEKPMASNIDEVKDLIDTAGKNNTYLHEGLIPIFHPNFISLKEALKSVGPIRQVTLNFSQYSSRYDAYLAGENPTTFRSELSNGALMDMGIYPIGICIGLWGKPEKVSSYATLLATGVDASGTSIFKYPDFPVSISYSKASNTGNLNEISGEKGRITFDMAKCLGEIRFEDRLTKNKSRIGSDKEETFYFEILDMIQNIKESRIESGKMPFELSLAIHEVITDCRRQSGIIYPCDS